MIKFRDYNSDRCFLMTGRKISIEKLLANAGLRTKDFDHVTFCLLRKQK